MRKRTRPLQRNKNKGNDFAPPFFFISFSFLASGRSCASLAQVPNFVRRRCTMSASLSVGGGGVRDGEAKAAGAWCSNVPSAMSLEAATAHSPISTSTSASTFPSTCSSSPSDALFPVVDLAPLLSVDDGDARLLLSSPPSPEALSASRAIAASLVATGCVLVRDPRASERDNSRFLDLLERYFEQPEGLKRGDARPELHYQIGATPEGIERPSLLREDSTSAARAGSLVEKIKAKNLNSSHLPTWPRVADPKWRFFWRVGPRPAETSFPELNSPQVVPQAFEEEWEETLDG